MKKYNLSETLKAKFAALLEDIDALARTLGKKPEDITDRDLAAIAKMKPRERPNFFLDGVISGTTEREILIWNRIDFLLSFFHSFVI